MIFAEYKFSNTTVAFELYSVEKNILIQDTFLVFLVNIFLIMIYLYINIGNVMYCNLKCFLQSQTLFYIWIIISLNMICYYFHIGNVTINDLYIPNINIIIYDLKIFL